ncbi:pyrophosphatase [Chiayiivirga flava]|uniref:MazG C-terminal domain-containing protein n=1 Tax=Chiayiivirga flava TaxID=659595 RepID=A0A7W8D725_9GAMM|nr:pyrophosphatase [Chiayiivirga flava]MBB5207902.1 hypothetical protein [Chiayiivirga flava]
MTTAKKNVREKSAYPGFRRAAEEEFGDTLWYFAAVCRRLNVPFDEVFAEAASYEKYSSYSAASDIERGAVAYISMPKQTSEPLDSALIQLGKAAANLLETRSRSELVLFARSYIDALNAAGLVFSDVARANTRKAIGAFVEPTPSDLADLDFDCTFRSEEQLPRQFRILVNQRASGRSYLQWNNVFIGDPLTDNIADEDGYRFHDVFHFSYAAILHWSPVMRALIKQKRKSRGKYDEEQDSGRAIVVEEGLTAWIFSRAKELNFFEGQNKVSFGILKTIEQFVKGYEVDRCPLKLWERAILDGYAVFRQIKESRGGWIIGNREQRTIQFAKFDPTT